MHMKGHVMMNGIFGTAVAAAVAAVAAASPACAAPDSSAGIGDVRLKGRLGEKLELMIERHVAARDVDYITAPCMEKT